MRASSWEQNKMRVAILDLGTNTFNIFVAEIFPNQTYKKVYKSKISVKLGEGGINNNFIESIPFERGINALKKHKKTILKYKAERVIAFATSAIRSASNGSEFVTEVKKNTGIEIEVISGEREAELIYYGVRSAVKMTNAPVLIMDIGGGSTEFIIAQNDKIFWKQSFLLGAARLLDKFKPSNPITVEEIKNIENYFEENLNPLFSAIGTFSNVNKKTLELIGSSGSFDSLAEMIGFRFYQVEALKGKSEYAFDLPDFEKMNQIIILSTAKERLSMKGLTKMRVDMIVISSIFVNYILKRLDIKQMRGSKYSLKEGILWESIHS